MDRCKTILEKLSSSNVKDIMIEINSVLNKMDVSRNARISEYLGDEDKLNKLDDFVDSSLDDLRSDIEKFIKKL